MRKITFESVDAFLNNVSYKKANMEVRVVNETTTWLLLHNNIIAINSKDDGLYISNCGWFTPTTRERLNALPNVSIYQKNYIWYLNGKIWDGKFTKVN